MTAAGDTDRVISLLHSAGSTVNHLITSAATTEVQPLLPVDGLVDDGLANAAVQAGSTVAVVSPALFKPVTPAAGQPTTTTASTTLRTGSGGTLPALVTDDSLQALLTDADSGASPRLQEQNLLAELAVITSELPSDQTERTVVLEAPRDWDVPAAFSTHLVDALGAVSYVSTGSLATIEGAPGVDRSRVDSQPSSISPLPASTIATVDNERPMVRALHAVATDPDESISPPYGEGLDRSLSAWWRGPNSAAGAQELKSVANDLTDTINKIVVGGGPHGVLLTGPSGTLPVQVSNLLPESVSVVVHVESDGLDQVTGRDQRITLDPGNDPHQVSVPITTRSTRTVAVTMQLLAQSDPSQVVSVTTISVRSSAVGKVAVGITATALTFLVLLILVRGIRRLAARRRSAASE